MKKMNRLFTGLLAFTCIVFTSCFNPIFYEIRKDVKPEPTTLKSYINQITRYKEGTTEYLVVASDQGLRYKRADSVAHDTWEVMGVPFKLISYDFDSSTYTGEQIIGVFADSSTLYALTCTFAVNDDSGISYPNKVSLWAKTSATGTWKNTPILEGQDNFPIYLYDDYYYSAFDIFQTNSVNNANRKVYLRIGNPGAKNSSYTTVKYYEISSSGKTENTAGITGKAESGHGSCLRSVVYVNGDVKFFNSYAAVTNEDETVYYYSDGNNVLSSNNHGTVSVGKPVTALAYCTDALLIGCGDYTSTSTSSSNGGIYKASVTTNNVSSSTVGFTSNASFQIPDSYYVTALLNADPSKKEAESSLYCASQVFGNNSNASYDNIGLWSYYPTRGNWNRE